MNYSPIEEVALTQKLVRIESTNPGAFEYKVSDFVYDFLAQTGADVLRHEVKDGRCNIVATLKGEQSGPRLVYICHQDTVPLGDGWHHDPLAAEIIDGRMYGRGSCDMKSGLAAGMLAFRNIAAMGKKLKHDFLFIASMDEEDIMIGADKLIADGIVRADDYVLDAAPTNGAIKVAHKGKTWFRLDAKGVACHASTPEKGSDAVAALSEVICAINHRLRALPVHPELGPCAATFGIINGGLNLNIVPGECYCTIDMRLTPPTTNEQSIRLVEAAIAEGCANVPGTSCTYTVLAQRPAVEKDNDSYLLKMLRAATKDVTGEEAPVDFFPGYTDTAVIAATTGNRNCMSYGPGDLFYAHKPDEFVELDDITRCTRVMTRLAESILIDA